MLAPLDLNAISLMREKVFWLAALAMTTAYAIKGGCRHIYYLDPTTIPTVLKYNYIAQAIGILSMAIGKLSVGALIIRILGKSAAKWQLRTIYAILITYMLLSIINVILNLAQCSPMAALWDKSIINAHCWN